MHNKGFIPGENDCPFKDTAETCPRKESCIYCMYEPCPYLTGTLEPAKSKRKGGKLLYDINDYARAAMKAGNKKECIVFYENSKLYRFMIKLQCFLPYIVFKFILRKELPNGKAKKDT